MSTITAPIPERLIKLPELPIQKSSHPSFEDGHCAMELVAWLAGEEHSDSPACADPVITSFTIALNDALRTDERRAELLGPVLPRIVGTRGSDDLTTRRRWVLTDWVVRTYTPMVLDHVAGLAGHAAALRALAPITDGDTLAASFKTQQAARDAARTARGEAWRGAGSWYERRQKIRDMVNAELAKKPATTAAATAAADDAATAAAAAATATTATTAAAATTATAAAATAAAAAAAAATTAAAAAAAATADADATAADATAATAAVGGHSGLSYSQAYDLVYGRAYEAARAVYDEATGGLASKIEEARRDAIVLLIETTEPVAPAPLDSEEGR